MSVTGLPVIERMRYNPHSSRNLGAYRCWGFGHYAYGETRNEAFDNWRHAVQEAKAAAIAEKTRVNSVKKSSDALFYKWQWVAGWQPYGRISYGLDYLRIQQNALEIIQ